MAQLEPGPEFRRIKGHGPPQHQGSPVTVAGRVLELAGEQNQARRGLGIEGLLVIGEATELREGAGVAGADPGAEGVAPRVGVGRPRSVHQPPPIGVGPPLVQVLGEVAAGRLEVAQQGAVGFELAGLFGGGALTVELDQHRSHPSPECGLSFVLVGQEVGAVGQQERTEPAPTRISCRNDPAFEQASEVALSQVEGLLRSVSLAADVGVKWIPIRCAKVSQGLVRPSRSPVASRNDPAPPGRRETPKAGRFIRADHQS
jgi:hypothetical protein